MGRELGWEPGKKLGKEPGTTKAIEASKSSKVYRI